MESNATLLHAWPRHSSSGKSLPSDFLPELACRIRNNCNLMDMEIVDSSRLLRNPALEFMGADLLGESRPNALGCLSDPRRGGRRRACAQTGFAAGFRA